MRELATTVTQRGQVTIPSEVRRRLGIKPRDKVTFRIEDDGGVRIVPQRYTLETVFGSVAPLRRPEDFEAISRAVSGKGSAGGTDGRADAPAITGLAGPRRPFSDKNARRRLSRFSG